MEIKSYSRVSMPPFLIFKKADELVVNPVQIITIEKFEYNGKDEFLIDKNTKEEKIFRVSFGTRLEMYIDLNTRNRLAKALEK